MTLTVAIIWECACITICHTIDAMVLVTMLRRISHAVEVADSVTLIPLSDGYDIRLRCNGSYDSDRPKP